MQKPPHRNGTTAAHPSFTSRKSLAPPTLGRQAPSNGNAAPVDRSRLFPMECRQGRTKSISCLSEQDMPGMRIPVNVVIATADGME